MKKRNTHKTDLICIGLILVGLISWLWMNGWIIGAFKSGYVSASIALTEDTMRSLYILFTDIVKIGLLVAILENKSK